MNGIMLTALLTAVVLILVDQAHGGMRTHRHVRNWHLEPVPADIMASEGWMQGAQQKVQAIPMLLRSLSNLIDGPGGITAGGNRHQPQQNEALWRDVKGVRIHLEEAERMMLKFRNVTAGIPGLSQPLNCGEDDTQAVQMLVHELVLLFAEALSYGQGVQQMGNYPDAVLQRLKSAEVAAGMLQQNLNNTQGRQ